MLRNKRKLIIIIGACVLVAAAVVFFVIYYSSGGNKTGYWPDSSPDAETVKAASWEFDKTQLGEDEFVLSVSPSGKYILAAGGSSQSETVNNIRGLLLNRILLYENKGGAYTLAERIDIDAEADPDLNDTLATCREGNVAWLGDEQRVCVSALRGHIWSANVDVSLIDFTDKSVENLTGRGYDTADVLPQYGGNDSVYFIRHMIDEEKMARIRLMSIDVSTGELLVEADLSQNGIPAVVVDYAVHDGTVYYSLQSNSGERTGLYKAALGSGEQPTRLLNIFDMKRDKIHPYMLFYSSVQISQDGRYLCLSVHDSRLNNLDLPLVDHGLVPQSDPSAAKSLVTNGKWIPCHNVLLYDLRIGELIDPFTDAALQPHVVLATAATFAPDGKSLLCAVLFDGGPWTKAGLEIPTLYQIRLDTSTFDAMRIYTADVGFTPFRLAWLKNSCIQMSVSYGYMTLVTPAAYEGLAT